MQNSSSGFVCWGFFLFVLGVTYVETLRNIHYAVLEGQEE